jgi:hypothetical protein
MMVRCDCLVNCSNAGNKTCGSAHMAIAGNELSMRDLQGLTALRRGEEQGGHRCAVFQILACGRSGHTLVERSPTPSPTSPNLPTRRYSKTKCALGRGLDGAELL